MLVNYMAEAEEIRGKEYLPAQVNGFSRDVFNYNLINGNNLSRRFEVDNGEEEEKGVELSLGLSLNGRFGVDPKKAKVKLMRSSTVSTFMFGGGEESHAPMVPIAAYTPLSRTCSLPTESEEEWRKRKELQSLRRMEAKRRRMDKIKFSRVGRDKVDSEENSGEENGSNGNTNINGQDLDIINGNGNGNGNGNMIPSSQGSIGSQGSGSSGLSEFESQPLQVNKNNEAGSPSSVHKEQKAHVIPVSLVDKSAEKGAKDAKKMLRNVMLDMPCVSTTGNGPNGKKIEGFLYRYRKEEEVRIVCVCHGSFLSPAEFVKHAGGTEVEHPLRHIVVNPSPLL